MRWLIAAILFLVATPGFSQQNDAEKLFRAMEKKIKEAKSLKVVFEADDWFYFDRKIILRGSSQFADSNKIRMELEGKAEADEPKWLAVSDGKQVVLKGEFGPNLFKNPTPAQLDATARIFIARLGLFITTIGSMRNAAKGGDADKELPVGAFKLGAKERIRNRETQTIEYTIMADNKKDGPKVKLWIDSESMLPLKRYVEHEKNKEKVFTETYHEFIIDPQLDPKLFELPK